MKIRTIIAASALASVGAVTAVSASASAAPPNGQNCWGVVTSQRASLQGAEFGAHSSSFATPRMGLGNTAKAFDLSIPELGSFLASVDGIEETSC